MVRYIFIFNINTIDDMRSEIENIKKMIEELAKRMSQEFAQINNRLDAIEKKIEIEKREREQSFELLNNRITKLETSFKNFISCFKEFLARISNQDI